jgi:spermidine dehydrogenase
MKKRPMNIPGPSRRGRLNVSRRDFLNGLAVPLLAGGLGASGRAFAGPGADAQTYPPALTGMRGSHPGSFEVAHALAREGARWPEPAGTTDRPYDLVVVGAGVSGLAAAYFYRQQLGANARILILDNHDDFGGHAKRNEMTIDGHTLIGYGGSQSMEAPASYSIVARQLIREIGLDVEQFYDHYDPNFAERHGLGHGVLFRKETFGTTRLTPDAAAAMDPAERRARLDAYPVSDAGRRALERLYSGDLIDTPAVRAHLQAPTKVDFATFLRLATDMPDDGLAVLADLTLTFWGFGIDALSLAEMLDYPALGEGLGRGARALGMMAGPAGPAYADEPYIFHFPDGNAGVARLLVRSLIPGAVPGRDMADLVLARARYDLLDRAENGTRIRLGSTAVRVENTARGVEVVYVRDGHAERVEAQHAILACYNNMVPHLCPELGAVQREALDYPEKIPLVVMNIGLRNWRAIAAAGLSEVYTPGGFLVRMGLDFPVSMGGYAFSRDPDQPVILDCWHGAAAADPGLDPFERLRQGRHGMLARPFAAYEAEARAQLDAAWGSHGLDVDRDIAAITVNRWPHGYTWEYTDLWDRPEWNRGAGPHVVGRQQIGRISIANADSEAFAYLDGAIDAAYRAVREQTGR